MKLTVEKSSVPTWNPNSTKPFFNKKDNTNFLNEPGKGKKSFFNYPLVQPKLKIGKPDDRYEMEADAMAEKVTQSSQSIQQQCKDCDENKEKPLVQKKPIPQKATSIPTANQSKNGISQDLTSEINQSKNKGSALPKKTNQLMGKAFNNDFSHVRVHTDKTAIQMNRGLNSRAFTHGSDVYFNQGEYAPNSHEGKKLLAHELTHVVQQSGGSFEGIQRACGSAAVGPTPATCNLVSRPSGPKRYFFKTNCDEFESGEEARLIADVSALPSGTSVSILGMASSDGNPSFNESLSCNRANTAASALHTAGFTPSGIEATGPVPGTSGRSDFRAVSIHTSSPPPKPVTPPTPGTTCPSAVPPSSVPTSIGSRGGCASGSDFISNDFPGIPTRLEILNPSLSSFRPDMRSFSDSTLESFMKAELKLFAGSLGTSMASHFDAGSGTKLTHGTSSVLSVLVNASPTFAKIAAAAKSLILTQISIQAATTGHIDWTKFNVLPTPGSLPSANFNIISGDILALQAVLGGTQGLEVFIRDFKVDPISCTFTATLIFEICDDFGVDHSDLDPTNIGHGSPGLTAFWILQHERAPAHVAFENGVLVERAISGPL